MTDGLSQEEEDEGVVRVVVSLSASDDETGKCMRQQSVCRFIIRAVFQILYHFVH